MAKIIVATGSAEIKGHAINGLGIKRQVTGRAWYLIIDHHRCRSWRRIIIIAVINRQSHAKSIFNSAKILAIVPVKGDRIGAILGDYIITGRTDLVDLCVINIHIHISSGYISVCLIQGRVQRRTFWGIDVSLETDRPSPTAARHEPGAAGRRRDIILRSPSSAKDVAATASGSSTIHLDVRCQVHLCSQAGEYAGGLPQP